MKRRLWLSATWVGSEMRLCGLHGALLPKDMPYVEVESHHLPGRPKLVICEDCLLEIIGIGTINQIQSRVDALLIASGGQVTGGTESTRAALAPREEEP